MKKQVSIFSQSGINNPVNYVYYSDSGVFTWERTSEGLYTGSLQSGFTIDKMLPFNAALINTNGVPIFIACEKITNTSIQLSVTDSEFNCIDANCQFTLKLYFP